MSVWMDAVGLRALEWQLAAALCVFLSVSNAASGGKVGKCNSYLPGHKAQTPTHSCSPYSRYHTHSTCLHVYVHVCLCVPAKLLTRID